MPGPGQRGARVRSFTCRERSLGEADPMVAYRVGPHAEKTPAASLCGRDESTFSWHEDGAFAV